MGFESLTVEEKRQLQQSQDAAKLLNELFTDADPKVRREAQALARKKRPDLRFPELEASEAEERALAAATKETDALRKELEQERAARLKAEEVGKIRERGFDPELVYKAMGERGIVSLDTALAMFEAEQQLGESTAGSVRNFKHPMPEIPKEVMADNGSVDVDALRTHLIGKYFEETGQAKSNPLGFLRQ